MLREIETPNANPFLTPNNVILVGPPTSAEIVDKVGEILQTVDKFAQPSKSGFGKIKKISHPVNAIEYLFGYSRDGAIKDPAEYFQDCLKFAEKKHGKENIVSAVIHYDELTPHLTMIVVPIIERGGKPRQYNVSDGRDENGKLRRKTITKMVGATRWLSAKEFVGSRQKLSAMQTEFHEQVGAKHGLARGIKGSRATHQTVKAFYKNLPDLPPRIASATREQLIEFGKAAYLAAMRQKEELLKQQHQVEEQKKAAQKTLDALRQELIAKTGQQQEQLRSAAATIAAQDAQIRSFAASLRDETARLRAWIVDVLERVWTALSSPAGDAAARFELEAATKELHAALPPTPALRPALRQLADGSWRAAVIDAEEIEQWSDLYDDLDAAREAAESWISNHAGPAPGM